MKAMDFLSKSAAAVDSGTPFERDPARVLADVRSGYVSLQAARSDYGCGDPPRSEVRFELDVEPTAVATASSRI